MRIKNKQVEVVTDFNISNNRLVNVATPVNDFDAVNKVYIDNIVHLPEWGNIVGLLSDQTDLQVALDGKKDDFFENTAFNKDFGTIAGTVAEGNHLHEAIIHQTSGNKFQVYDTYALVNTTLDLSSNNIINLSYPIQPTDAASKQYVDDQIATIDQTDTQWGEVTGLLSDQLDLQSALNNKSDITHNHSNNLPTTVGYIPYWNSTDGTILANGYSVDTSTISGSATALVTSQLLQSYLSSTSKYVDSFDVDSTILTNGYVTVTNNIDINEHEFVILNGLVLDPNIDYTITNQNQVNLALEIREGDKIVIRYKYII